VKIIKNSKHLLLTIFLTSIYFFAVILDLKALYLLLVKDDDENFKLGKQGIDVEFCFICNAIRVCTRLFTLEGMFALLLHYGSW